MKITLISYLLFFALSINAQSQSPAGIWNTGKDNTKIEITETNGVYTGKILSSDNAKAKIGKQLLKDIQSVDGEWKGKLFAAKRGKWMDAVLEAKGKVLQITVKKGLMSKTIEWAGEKT
ncbi:MAG: hypothetical protein AAF960_13940 [Bacteroidota bacterium]